MDLILFNKRIHMPLLNLFKKTLYQCKCYFCAQKFSVSTVIFIFHEGGNKVVATSVHTSMTLLMGSSRV